MNRTRAARDLRMLWLRDDLSAVARRHTLRMVDAGRLFHDKRLPYEVHGWRALGENVGRASTLHGVYKLFLRSRSHLANIVSRRYTRIGVGVVYTRGWCWVTLVFFG